jgi:DivIVA domain-containing protein
MSLTPQEVHAVQFTTTRMRVGYEMDEVDAFLDRVEGALAGSERELQQAREREAVLRTQCEQLQARVDYLEAHPELRGDAESVMRIAQATADEIIAAARVEAARVRAGG